MLVIEFQKRGMPHTGMHLICKFAGPSPDQMGEMDERYLRLPLTANVKVLVSLH